MAAAVEHGSALRTHQVSEAGRLSGLIAQRAVAQRPEPLGARLGGQDPRPNLERRPVPDVLGVAAVELDDPGAFGVLMKPDDHALHGHETMAKVELADVSGVAARLDGVRERRRAGLLDWRYHGRLVARQLDAGHIVIRASFEFRDLLLRSFPETFAAPGRYARHMMVVADLEHGNADAVEDAVIAAWELQRGELR